MIKTESLQPRSQTWISRWDWKLFLPLLFPVFLIFLGVDWVQNYGSIDDWVYLGYFLNLKQHLNIFPHTYYGTRLPWLVPGFITYQLFPSNIAHYVLHLSFCSISIASLYFILKSTLSTRVALVVGLIAGNYSYFLKSMGNDYIDAAGVTYLLLTTCLLTKFGEAKAPLLRLFWAGFFFSCAMLSQLFLVVMIPLLLSYALFQSTDTKRLKEVSHIALGFCASTFLFCLIHFFLTGEFFFFLAVLQWTVDFVKTTNPWWIPIKSWFSTGFWLTFLIFVCPVATITLFSKKRVFGDERKYASAFSLLFGVAALIFWAVQFIAKQPVLQLNYYASYLLPFAFLSLGSFFHVFTNQWSNRKFWLVVSFPVIGMIATKISGDSWLLCDQAFIAYSIALILCISTIFKKYWVEISVVSLFFLSTEINSGFTFWKQQRPLKPADRELVIKNFRQIQQLDPLSESRFWYSGKSNLTNSYRATASLFLWGYRLVNEEFPSVHPDNLSYKLEEGHKIFVFFEQESDLANAQQNLGKLGFMGKMLKEVDMDHNTINYKIAQVQLVKNASPSNTAD